MRNSSIAHERYKVNGLESLTSTNLRLKEYSTNLNKVYLSKNLRNTTNEDEDSDFYAMNNITLTFKHPYVERSFKLNLIEKRIKFTKAFIKAIFVLYTV